MSTQLNFLTCEQALPLAVSPLARAFSRDLFHSPKQESLLVGYQNFNWQLTNRLKFNRQLTFVLGFTVNWQRTWLSLISTKSVFKAFLIILLHSFRQTQCTLKWIIGSLSSDVFERRTSTGSEVFSLLTCLDDIKFVFLSFCTVIETIWLKICAKPPSKNEKRPLPVDVRRSKTLLLKLPNISRRTLKCQIP